VFTGTNRALHAHRRLRYYDRHSFRRPYYVIDDTRSLVAISRFGSVVPGALAITGAAPAMGAVTPVCERNPLTIGATASSAGVAKVSTGQLGEHTQLPPAKQISSVVVQKFPPPSPRVRRGNF